MTVLGKKITGFANKIGSKLSYRNMRQLGNKLEKGVELGLREVRDVGGLVNKGLGKVIDISDKLRGAPVIGEAAALVGGGASQLRKVVDLGNKGVDKLEKVIDKGRDQVKTVSSAVYKNNPNPFKI